VRLEEPENQRTRRDKLSVLRKLKGERRGGSVWPKVARLWTENHAFRKNWKPRIRFCCNSIRVWSG